jgi:hypothetical protein
MYLFLRNEILTRDWFGPIRDILHKRGWVGTGTCPFFFCSGKNNVDHLFLFFLWLKSVVLDVTVKIFFRVNWFSFLILLISWSLQLNADEMQAFLLVVSVIYWFLWTHRNNLCFSQQNVFTTKRTSDGQKS